MLISQEMMRLLLLACLVGMAILAVLFLRRRKLSMLAYLGWGLVIIFLPLVGPFLVILIRPGTERS